jgi:hypothetical protein
MTDSPRLVAPARRAGAPVVALSAAAACVATGLAITTAITHRAAPSVDPCALPAGLDVSALPERDRSFLARHAIACNDYEHGRISAAEYKLTLKALDLAALTPPAPVAPPAPIWAATVRGFSSQYTDSSWAAARVLGPPDVYPAGGDNANAWASRDADAPTEFLEVGFDTPHRLRGVDIFETYNPGAVTHVEVITADGAHRVVYDGVARAMNVPSYQRSLAFACTDQKVVAVRVTLASQAVPGWNEIDAIGGTPCD